MKIQEIMTPECKWGARNMSVKDAAKIMKQQDIGFLPVGCTDQDKLVGTITDRDIVLNCVAEGKDPEKCTIDEIKGEKMYYCYEDQDVKEVCENMAEIRVRRLPVVDRNKRLVGVVSFGDVAQAAERKEVGETQQEFTRECANSDRKAA